MTGEPEVNCRKQAVTRFDHGERNRDSTSSTHGQQSINLSEIAGYDFHVVWNPEPYCLWLGDGADRYQWVAVVPRISSNDFSLFVCNVHD